MKHPYIGKSPQGHYYLVVKKELIYSFLSKSWLFELDGFADLENITREYLANTKVKIESEKHADFIIKLFSNAFDVCAESRNPKWVYNDGRKGVCQQFHGKPKEELKLITIPLPPKEPEPKEWPQVGDEVLTASKRKAKLIATHDYHAWVKYYEEDNTFSLGTVTIATLSKPLTPEEELAKELEKMVYDGMDNSHDLNHNCYYLVSGLMKKYDIKKKPE